MKVPESLRKKMLAQLGDPESLRIIVSVLEKKKTAIEIGKELSLPSTTLYRKILELRECGMLMTETFEFRPDGKREAKYGCTFREIILKTTERGLELEVVPSVTSLEKRWFELFFSKNLGGSE